MAITLNGLENQTKVITMNALGEYDNLRPQVKPVEATYAQMVTMRDQGKLIPGQLYRITDYVTTAIIDGSRSVGHPFDIIVMALDATTLSENAWAIQHDGDTYFANSNLAAWKLRYTLDNIKWSQVKGKFVVPDYTELKFEPKGTIEIDGTTYYLWYNENDTMGYDDYGMTAGYIATDTQNPQAGDTVYFVDLDQGTTVDDDYHVSVFIDFLEDGKGTILWMHDEFGNECDYDFKNIQFKVYKVSHSSLGDLGYISTSEALLSQYSVDTEDFIWAYTFSLENTAENTDVTVEPQESAYARNNVIHTELAFNVFFGATTNNNITGSKNCFVYITENCTLRKTSQSSFNSIRRMNANYISNSYFNNCDDINIVRIVRTSLRDSSDVQFIGEVDKCTLEDIMVSIAGGIDNKTISGHRAYEGLRVITYNSSFQLKDFNLGDVAPA